MPPLPALQISLAADHPSSILLLRDMASTTQMLLGVLVVDKKFSVLPVAVGLVAGHGDKAEDGRCLVEDDVHFLQGSVGCLWVEEVDHREDEGVAVEFTC